MRGHTPLIGIGIFGIARTSGRGSQTLSGIASLNLSASPNSLRVRQEGVLKTGQETYLKRRPLYSLITKRGRFTDSVRCLTLKGGFSHWEEYMQEARRHVSALGDRAIEIRYEEFISDAARMLKILARFSGLDADESMLNRIAAQAKPGRAYAYTSDHLLKDFAEQVSPQLRKNHY